MSPGPDPTPSAGSIDDPDEVDAIVEAWHRERPDVDVTPMQVLSRVSRLARHVDSVRKAAFAAHGLESWEFDVLAALRRSGEPYALSPGRLVAQTHVTSGTMTNRVDRLATRGLVERQPDPGDRRGVLVQLTGPGRDQVDGAIAELMRSEASLLEDLSPAEAESLATALRTLMRPFHTT